MYLLNKLTILFFFLNFSFDMQRFLSKYAQIRNEQYAVICKGKSFKPSRIEKNPKLCKGKTIYNCIRIRARIILYKV